MGRQNWRPSNMLYPAPAVLIGSADGEGRGNLMTAAWAGTVCSDPVMVSVSIRPQRFSHELITKTGEFTINLTTTQLTFATDFCGVRSGRDINKFEALHLTPLPSAHIGAPGVAESPVVLECKVKQCLHLGIHDMFIAEVVGVSVDDRYLDRRGRLALEKADLIAYSHGEYFSLGEKLGTFGFSVRKKAAGTAASKVRKPGGTAAASKDRKVPGKAATARSKDAAQAQGRSARSKPAESGKSSRSKSNYNNRRK